MWQLAATETRSWECAVKIDISANAEWPTREAITTDTMDALIQYHWPGNIRELENMIERAVVLSPPSVLHIPLRDLQSRLAAGPSERPDALADVEREHIRAILKQARWVLSGPNGAAARLGLNRSTLYFRMKKLGIIRPWS